MTEEEAIEQCKRCLKSQCNGCIYDDENCERIHNIAIETILNLIQKQQEEINLLKEQKECVLDEYSETIEKQGKIIDLMAKDKYENVDMYEIADMAKEIDYSIPKLFSGIPDEEVYSIIKQYYERKAENNR